MSPGCSTRNLMTWGSSAAASEIAAMQRSDAQYSVHSIGRIPGNRNVTMTSHGTSAILVGFQHAFVQPGHRLGGLGFRAASRYKLLLDGCLVLKRRGLVFQPVEIRQEHHRCFRRRRNPYA